MASNAQTATGDSRNGYEVSDYVSLAPTRDYVLIRHYRTVHRDGGQITNEPVSSTEELLDRMIRAFDGRCLHVPNGLRGIFKDPQQAELCAEAVSAHHRKPTEVSGKELFIPI